jgi:hypothetical protein
MEDQEKHFAKGFNAGYLLSKHEPDLLKQLLKSTNKENEYFQGLELGKKQHDREKLLQQIKHSNKTRNKDRER